MKLISASRSWVYFATILLFVIAKLSASPIGLQIASGLAVISFLVSLPVASWGARILAGLFTASGLAMLFANNVALTSDVFDQERMLSLLALFAALPVLSVPIDLGQYGHSMAKVLRARVQSIFHLNILVTTFAFVCGSFMSLASIPIMMSSMAPAVQHYPLRNSVRFRSVAAIYGYVLPILWTPVSGVVGIVVHSLNVQWIELLPLLVFFSLAGLVLNWGVFYLVEQPAPLQAETMSQKPLPQNGSTLRPELSHLSQILIAVAVMVTSIAMLDHFVKIGMMMSVTLIAIPFAAAWSLCIGFGVEFLATAKQHLTTQVLRMSDQFAVFLAAGFFVSALHTSALDQNLNQGLIHLHQHLGTTLFLMCLPVMALATSLIGIHPVVAIALLGESLQPGVLGIASPLLAVTLIGSAVLTYMLGPFGGTLGLMQSVTQVSSYRLALWNVPYALAFWLLLMAFILVMGIG